MMTEMLIDNQDIKAFGARLLSFSVGGSTVTQNMSADNICNVPAVFSTSVGTRTLTVTLVFQPSRAGDNSKNVPLLQRYANSTDNVTRFEAYLMFHGTVEILLPDGYLYSSVCTSLGAGALDGTGEQEVAYNFTAVRHKPLQIISLTGLSTTVLCEATTAVYCRVSLTADKDYNSITIFGITVNNISANDVIVIDGIDKSVTKNGVNIFNDTDLIEFPTLKQGKNTITVSSDTVKGYIEYYPIYC